MLNPIIETLPEVAAGLTSGIIVAALTNAVITFRDPQKNMSLGCLASIVTGLGSGVYVGMNFDSFIRALINGS